MPVGVFVNRCMYASGSCSPGSHLPRDFVHFAGVGEQPFNYVTLLLRDKNFRRIQGRLIRATGRPAPFGLALVNVPPLFGCFSLILGRYPERYPWKN